MSRTLREESSSISPKEYALTKRLQFGAVVSCEMNKFPTPLALELVCNFRN